MRWVIEDQELLLEDNDSLRRIPADEIWQNEGLAESNTLPPLETIGLYPSHSTLEPICIVAPSAEGDFGKLSMRYKAANRGPEIKLSATHMSDHVVLNDEWIPIDQTLLEEVRAALNNHGLTLGTPLSAKAYMECVRDFEEEPWFSLRFSFEAKQWSDKPVSKQVTQQPVSFTATLSDYQIRGSNWLTMMAKQMMGMILGDGMGLGKTVQAIKAVCDLFERTPDARVLIVCPSSLIENWCREFDKFTAGIEILRHVGPDRTRNYRQLNHPVVITTYDVVARDYTVIGQLEWDFIIADEAQYVKNPHARRTRALKSIPKRVGIAMTGTPFENHMTDIWSIMDFCIPGFLGTEEAFVSRYKDDNSSAVDLGRIIKPLMLRRRLCDIPNDLPDLVVMDMPIALDPMEAADYETRKEHYMQDVGALGAISKLRAELAKYCDDPSFISIQKYEYLNSVVAEVVGFNEKIIVFAETYNSIDAIRKTFSDILPVYQLTGKTAKSERQPIVDSFSVEPGAAMLICNPIVGGAGLNITAANHVFHFATQWNPAKIDQADARAHRRGQNSVVTTHYPYYALTIEEYMWEKVNNKRELSSRVVTGNNGDLTTNELLEALSLDPTKGRTDQ